MQPSATGASSGSRRTSGAAKQFTRQDLELAEDIGAFFADPLGFVLYAFPWGKKGTRLAEEFGPDDWQIRVLDELGKAVREGQEIKDALPVLLAVASGHGIGKALANSTIIPTPTGYRRWGSLRPGDKVWGRDGTPTDVVAIHPQGRRRMYRVNFDDGSSTLADAEHLWTVRGRQGRRTSSGWETINTAEIMRRGVKRRNGNAEARQWEIPQQEPVQYDAPAPLDGYLMGCWLGDGTANAPRISGNDPEMIAELRARGFDITDESRPDRAGAYYVRGGHLRPWLGKGAHEKRIPVEFLTSRIDDRLDLLRGLMDTDGTATKGGRATFTTTSEGLADDIMELVRSLGGKASLHPTPRRPNYTHRGDRRQGRMAYTVTVTTQFNPFGLSRKAILYRAPTQERYLSRWIESIEEAQIEEAMCITVSAPDALYLANNYIVTHNTALISWIILWFISTRQFPQIVVTAGKKEQLTSKTWRELAKWSKMAINGHWFVWTSTKLEHALYPDTWYASAIPWSKNAPENFAGTHEEHVLVVYDEASAIDDVIWEVTDGAMTTPGAMWIAFGNPTKNTGRFHACFNKFRDLWRRFQIDSREAKKANRRLLDLWVKLYGEDSDFVKVRVRGVFPSAGDLQFIPSEDVQAAIDRVSKGHEKYGKVLGVDVARHGTDQSVFVLRQGRKQLKLKKMRIPDTMQLAALVAEAINDWQPDAVFVDATGIGWGVVDRLHQMGFTQVIGVQVGERAMAPERFYNRRAELWFKMREWIQDGGDLINDTDQFTDLTGIEYGFDGQNRWVLESKDDMKERGLDSPDTADALALTFHSAVAPTKAKPETWRKRLSKKKLRRRSGMAA